MDRSVAVVTLVGDVRTWIHRFKYPRDGLAGLDPAATGVMRMLARRARRLASPTEGDPIVPMPLYPRRYRERGFNPASLLAREIARPGRHPLRPRWLIRLRDTERQTGLDAASRRRNVAGAFACRPSSEAVPGRVWLVDDVTTTGATLEAAAAALKGAGVREVIGLCVARTPAREEIPAARGSLDPSERESSRR